MLALEIRWVHESYSGTVIRPSAR